MNRFTPSFRALAIFSVASALALGGHALGACNSDPLIQPPACTPGECDCDQDPTQPACRGYNDRPEGGKDPADANEVDQFIPDTSMPDMDAGDDGEAGDDGGDE